MLKKIQIGQLRVGMYVHLPFAWYKHSFIRNKFTINSETQITKIKEIGINEITIDANRGDDVSEEPATVRALQKDPEIQMVPDKLLEAIRDQKLPAPEKAAIIHDQATEMMQRLLDNPSAINIQAVKKGITEVVDLIHVALKLMETEMLGHFDKELFEKFVMIFR